MSSLIHILILLAILSVILALPTTAEREQYFGVRRRLSLLGKSKNEFGMYPASARQGLPESYFDAYCRYGCGGMAVTFPYYYRPFFGYGYPLTGTEGMFPQGYGGYPAAEIMSRQPAGAVTLPGPTIETIDSF
eukprot:GHVS01065618.1.p1 GENE.GHVS01065618.1~~GHVS01065618.1.p1  ORF type:complete len:133 (-),score=18.26 GHVS01065618.1:78-476(-)